MEYFTQTHRHTDTQTHTHTHTHTHTYIYIYFIFSKTLLSSKKCFVFARYITNLLYLNIWKDLCWTHFYNLKASLRRWQRQKNFVILSGFWSLRGCGGVFFSEYIKLCDENVAVAI